MSLQSPGNLACSLLLIACLAGAGCTSAVFGDVTYTGNELHVAITNSGVETEAWVQVTVFELKDFHQEEVQSIQQEIVLKNGSNEIVIPAKLAPGRYKLYLYILKPGERQTATIRDIVV
ncbi:MAG: hypothetical protein GYA23_02300 [Methanomicrobiales archaeon]|nr:hypothetical protein [Methanomicrobiales archaeon]